MNIRPSSIQKILDFSKDFKTSSKDSFFNSNELCKKWSISTNTVRSMRLLGYIIHQGKGKYITTYDCLEPIDARKIALKRNSFMNPLLK